MKINIGRIAVIIVIIGVCSILYFFYSVLPYEYKIIITNSIAFLIMIGLISLFVVSLGYLILKKILQ